MVITEVRMKLINSSDHERLRAFCSITLDNAFVVLDLKIIEGINGWFVAFPSRKLTDRCLKCDTKNHLRARFCNQCGGELKENRAICDGEDHSELYADIVYPINSACRQVIQATVFKAFVEECERARQPNYVCTYDNLPHQPTTGRKKKRAFGAGILD